jgi:hypothetical protein
MEGNGIQNMKDILTHGFYLSCMVDAVAHAPMAHMDTARLRDHSSRGCSSETAPFGMCTSERR